jgi:hypothetical protein
VSQYNIHPRWRVSWQTWIDFYPEHPNLSATATREFARRKEAKAFAAQLQRDFDADNIVVSIVSSHELLAPRPEQFRFPSNQPLRRRFG